MQRDNEQLHKDKDDLQSQLDGVMVANSQLASCNSILRSKCDQMLEQLSVKEANWSHHEEELQLQVRWGLYKFVCSYRLAADGWGLYRFVCSYTFCLQMGGACIGLQLQVNCRWVGLV